MTNKCQRKTMKMAPTTKHLICLILSRRLGKMTKKWTRSSLLATSPKMPVPRHRCQWTSVSMKRWARKTRTPWTSMQPMKVAAKTPAVQPGNKIEPKVRRAKQMARLLHKTRVLTKMQPSKLHRAPETKKSLMRSQTQRRALPIRLNNSAETWNLFARQHSTTKMHP